jgi:hypothetical protein
MQTGWVRTIRWLLLFITGTIVCIFLAFVVPYVEEAAESLIYSTLFWLDDRYPNSIAFLPTRLTIASGLFAGTYTFDVWILAFVLTAIYFGIIVALLGSGNKRQALVAVGLIIIYLSGTGYVLFRRMFAILN